MVHKALLRNQPPLFLTITCLCGSTRFFAAFMEANYKLTMMGKIVLSVGFFMHAAKKLAELTDGHHAPTSSVDEAQKAMLDELHLRKIDIADEVYVVNVGGYIGASTKREIWYAYQKGKHIDYLERDSMPTEPEVKSWFKDWDEWRAAAQHAAQPTSIT